MHRLNDFLVPMMQRMDLYQGARDHVPLQLWDQVVGPLVARNTVPVSVRGGIMFVRTASSAWMNELSAGFRHQYRERLNALLGEERISDIRFLPPPLPERKAEGKAARQAIPRMPLGADDEVRIAEVAAVVADPEARARVARTMRRALQTQAWRLREGWRPCPGCGDLVEDGARCVGCREVAAAERQQRIRDTLLALPWLSAPDLRVRIDGVTPATYEREKKFVMHGVQRKLERWEPQDEPFSGDALVWALTYAMLRTGKMPRELAHDDIRYALGPLAARYPFK